MMIIQRNKLKLILPPTYTVFLIILPISCFLLFLPLLLIPLTIILLAPPHLLLIYSRTTLKLCFIENYGVRAYLNSLFFFFSNLNYYIKQKISNFLIAQGPRSGPVPVRSGLWRTGTRSLYIGPGPGLSPDLSVPVLDSVLKFGTGPDRPILYF